MDSQNKDSKGQLVEAARELFAAEGLAGFSMRKIAKRCDLSATALYRHFTNKEELLLATVLDGIRQFASYLQLSLNEATPLLRFQKSIKRYFDFALEKPSHYQLIFRHGEKGLPETLFDKAACDEMDATFEFLVERIGECQKIGLFRQDPVQSLALHTWASIHGIACLAIDGHFKKTNSTTEILEEHILFISRSLF